MFLTTYKKINLEVFFLPSLGKKNEINMCLFLIFIIGLCALNLNPLSLLILLLIPTFIGPKIYSQQVSASYLSKEFKCIQKMVNMYSIKYS